jgi:quinol monooxygenase YgiN
MSSVVLYAWVAVRPQYLAEVKAVCQSIAEASLTDDGCMAFYLLEDADEPEHLAWFEQWRDEQSLAAHMASPNAARLGAALDGKLTGPMTIRRHVIVVST